MYTEKATWNGQTIEVLTSAASHGDIFAPRMRVKVHEVGFIVGVQTDGASTVKFDITTGASRGDGDGGVVTIPTATTVNSVVKDTTSTIFPYVLTPGAYITPEVTSAAATAGQGYYYIIYEVIEDVSGNETTVTESA